MSDDDATTSGDGHKRRWGRWVLLVLALAVAGALVVPSVLSNRAEREIGRRVEQYRSAGEPVTPADLSTPPVIDEENAVVEISEAGRLISSYGNASATWKRYVQRSDLGYPLTAKEKLLARAIVAENAGVLKLLDAAMQKDGFYWPNQPTSPVISWMLPELSPQRQLANFLGIAALVDHDRGDDAAALRDVRRLLFIGRALEHHPQCLVVALVATSNRNDAYDRLEKIAPDLKIGGPDPKAASPEAVAEVIGELLDETESDEAFRRALLSERVVALNSTGVMFAGQLPPGVVGGPAAGAMAFAASPVGRYVTGPLVRADLILMLDAITTMRAAMSAPDWPSVDGQIAHVRDAVQAAPTRHFWAARFLPSVSSAVETAYRARTERRLAAVALAARWYAVEHDGRLPAKLEELVPKYLPAVPGDPFAPGGAAALRYAADPADPRVYSVGHNGVDDGGSDEPTRSNAKRSDRWAGRDAVVHLRRTARDVKELSEELRD